MKGLIVVEIILGWLMLDVSKPLNLLVMFVYAAGCIAFNRWLMRHGNEIDQSIHDGSEEDEKTYEDGFRDGWFERDMWDRRERK